MSLLLGGVLLASAAFAQDLLLADEVVRYALAHHPDPIGARQAIEVAKAERREVALLSANPALEAQLSGSTQYVQGAQPISPTGAGFSARKAARLQAEAALSAAQRTDLVVATEARLAWMRAAAADRQAVLAEELLALAGSLRQTVEALAAADEASILDVNLARVAEARAVADTLALRAEAAKRRQELAAFHPDALGAPLSEPEDALPAGGLASVAEPASSARDLGRSDVAAAKSAVLAAEAALRREKRERLPSLGLGAWVQQSEGVTSAGPFVEAELPLFGRNQGQVASARAELARAEARAAQVEQVARTEQSTTRALVEAARRDIGRIEGVEGAAREALVAIGRGFDAGELDLATAVLLRAEVFDGQIASIDARVAAIEAGLLALLAHEDEALLGGSP